MEDKLDKILKNQEILNKNQLAIYGVLMKIEEKLPSGGKEFLRNYLADIDCRVGISRYIKYFKEKIMPPWWNR